MTFDMQQPRRRYPVGKIDEFVFRAAAKWSEFWFTPADPISLGLLRILVGGMLIYSHWVWGLDLAAFLGSDGWNSAELIRAAQRNQWNLSFWWLVPESSMQSVHQGCLIVLVLFWIGCCTRITSILAFAIHISYCQRAAIANYGLDQIEGILLLYLTIGSSGAALSVDSLVRQMLRGNSLFSIPITKTISTGLALRLIQVHYCIIYFFSGTAKLQGESWWTGDAMWNVFANYEYQSTDLTWLAWYPSVLQFLAHATILWELSFAYLIWIRPLRPIMLFLGTAMHLGIGGFLGMWTFGLTMIFGYIAFLNPETIRTILRLPKS